MKKLALVSGSVLAAAAAAVALGLQAGGRDAPGFLGPGTLIADVNLMLEILLVLGVTFGFALARTGSIEAHRVNQTGWVLVNAALVACIMAPSMDNVKIGSASDLGNARVALTWLHALIGTCTVAAGLWLVLQMNDVLPRRVHVRGWKNLMRLTLAGYWAVALLGFATYYFWYVA
jgi:hypothetical protein